MSGHLSQILTATEILVDTMQRLGIKDLVHVGDAYSALPIEDNYGLGEHVFIDYPRDYMLGDYGESRTRAEMYARIACRKDSDSFHGVFLRPVHVHGEAGSSSWSSLMEMAEQGNIPYIVGERRGMHQFFLERRVCSSLFSPKVAVSFEKSFLKHYIDYIKYNIGLSPSPNSLSYPMFRFLFAKTIGFSNRKQRILLDFIPEVSQEESMKLSLQMSSEFPGSPRAAVRSG
ncbi:hypothetical protein NECAME_06598 [Necator americanus]|uniref:3-beta hydroxysteroid dehydrogenase/isomerase domain-containing protein n=1 Tax=Necator americanus TaxID=51031 RepID=W2TVF5_NECAM|nr:hypothetical protein NECAME_06598 [Necator americanus]ETN85051.1 hypothetical protein NECAME_06598 [Necator americanus]